MSTASLLPVPNLPCRLQVMLTPATATAVKRLAKLQGRSSSAVARDFLDEARPLFERIAGLLELAQKAEGKWPKELLTRMEAMQGQLEHAALEAMETLDTVAADAAAHRRGAQHGRRRAKPPSSNRGVKR